MAYQDRFYTIGDVTVESGSAVVTGTGTGWETALIDGGVIFVGGGSYPIYSVESETALTLAYPYTDASGADLPYAIDRQRAAATSNIQMNDRLAQIIREISVGNIEGLNALEFSGHEILQTDATGRLIAVLLAANKLLRTDNSGNIAQSDLSVWAISMLGLTGTADRLPYLNAANTSALTPLTAFARSILDDANAAAVRTTLGLGTASTRDVGTSGSVIPVLSAQNVWSAYQWLALAGNGPLGINMRSTANSGTIGNFNVSPILRLQLSRGAFDDSNGAYGSIQYEENVGTSNQFLIHINGFGTKQYWQFRQDGSAYALGGSWINSSDGRLKTKVKNIPDPLSALKKLNGCTWTRIDSGASGIGLIAQDAEEAVPGCSQVSEKEKTLPDGTTITDVLALDTGGVAAAVLVEACKMMLERIEQLESRITELTA